MNELQIFENEEFGKIRTAVIDGEPWFVAADVCRALEIRNPSETLKRLDDDERSTLSLTEGTSPKGGNPNMNIVNEPGLYVLVLGSRKPEAKDFKRWITHEVIPSIRKTGSYSVALSPAELLVKQAQLLLEHERRMDAVEENQKALAEDITEIKAQIETHPTGWYTVAGYASLTGANIALHEAKRLGKRAAALSRDCGYAIGKTPDARFGHVNVYHEDVLKEVFGKWEGANASDEA